MSQDTEVLFDPDRSRANYKSWFPELSDVAVENLLTYQGQLNKFNKAVNLVSPTTLKSADAVHLGDAVLATKFIVPNLQAGASLYDLGSGNGFPGLVIGILNPGLKVVLVDRDERKLEFCKHVASFTGAANVATLKSNVEDLPEQSLTNVVARGFAPLAKALLLTRGLVKLGGQFFHLKSDNWAVELSQVPSQLFSFWQPKLLGSYRLPGTEAEMSVVVTNKIK